MELSAIRGTGVALVTPFSDQGQVDYDALEKIIDHVIAGGVNHLVTLGTTGETPVLSDEEKKEIIRFTVEKTQNRVPVIAGIGGNNTKEILHQMETYPLEQVEAILSVSPYYSRPSAEGLYQHYKTLAEASPKPLILYNVPARTGRNIPAGIVLRLAKDFENIAAVKEASGDLIQCMKIIRDKPTGFMVVSGDDMLTLSQIAMGMEGVISVAGNFMAKGMSSMVEAALNNHFEEAQQLHYKMMSGFELMFEENNPAGIKAFLSVAGLCKNNLRLPNVEVSANLLERITRYMAIYTK